MLAGSLLAGTFLSPGFALCLSGALASLMVLGLAVSLGRKALSEVGYSVLAALAHMRGQIGAASYSMPACSSCFRS
ncbi:MAG: Gx transporter family protein [Gammaproteobacteria bacterium]